MSIEMTSFRDDFFELCKSLGDEVMIIYDTGIDIIRYTYSDVYQRCVSFSGLFSKEGIKAGDTIVTIMPNSLEAAICFFSALINGINYAPLPCSVTNREFDNWIRIVKPGLIIKKTGIADYQTAINTINCNCDGNMDWLSDGTCPVENNETTSQVFLMTSGTTGTPKAMSINADRLWNSGKAFIEQYGMVGSGIRFWNYLPMSYLGGLFNLALIPVAAKGSFVISEPFSGKTILNFWPFVKKHDITALWFVPSIVQGLLKISSLVGKNIYDDVCKDIRISFLGTAPISLKQKEEFEERFNLRLFENFALSETTFITYENNDNLRYREQGSVGEMLPYVSMKFVPVEGFDDVSTIWVKTPFLFNGYLSEEGTIDINPDSDGFFNTQDLGRLNEDGLVVLSGRNRDIIKKGGLFVSLIEIENIMKDYPGVDEAVAVPIEHEFYGESYLLFVKHMDGIDNEKNIKEMHLWMLDNFVSYKLPEKIHAINEIPRTSSGKIQKRKLLEMLEG